MVRRAVDAVLARLPEFTGNLVQASGLKTPSTDLCTLSRTLLSEAERASVGEKIEGIDRLIQQGTHFEDAPKLAEDEIKRNGNKYFNPHDFATLRVCVLTAMTDPKSAAILIGDFLDRKATALEPASRFSDELAKGLVVNFNRARTQLKLITSELMTPKALKKW